jgi:hypothetical protein
MNPSTLEVRTDMSAQDWNAARLSPTSGINGAEEQERRATSALLAVMASVREFGRVLTQPLGAPAGRIETYIETPFVLGDRKVIPDGLIRVSRGTKQWTALVEVKTGTNELGGAQLESYLDVARDQRFDSVITISNQISPAPDVHPTRVDRRKVRRVPMHHWSWSQVLAAAVVQKEHRGVADPDQAWILGELIRYLEHPRSGALEFDDMGPDWVSVRDAVIAGTLRASDKTAPRVAARFDALLRYVSLRLGRQLGTEVSVALSRKEASDPKLRTHSLIASLCEKGRLEGAIRIPHTVAPLSIVADLRSAQIICQVTLDAPGEGRPITRVNWLLRQLRAASDGLRVEACVAHQRGSGNAELLRTLREQPQLLIADAKKEIRTFAVARTQAMGSKRKAGRGSFIDSVIAAVDTFYGEVMQNLKPWTPPAPKLRQPVERHSPVAAIPTTSPSPVDTESVLSRAAGHPDIRSAQTVADPPSQESAAAEGL